MGEQKEEVKVAKPTKFCQNCGEEIDAKAEVCPKCGVRVKPMRVPKSPGLAAVLSVLLIGLGQFYNGQIGKGFLFLALGAISAFLTTFVIGFITTPILYIWSIIDAYKTAKKINAGEEI